MNIKTKLNWKLGFLSPLILSPLIVASCASATSEQQQQPTQVVEQIPAAVLQLENLKPAAALAKIDANLIFQARNQIFQNHKIDKVDQIRLLDSQVISESSILVDVELAAQAYYDSQGNLGYQAKQFTFAISGFQVETQPPIADAEQIQAHLQQLANQATFDVSNKTNLFASQVSAQQINWNEAQANSKITFKAFNLIFDDAAGKLGFSALFAYKNINQFIKIDPKSSRAISGFKIKNDSQLNDQQAVGIEILRLINLNQAGNLVSNNLKFTIQEIQNFVAQPNSFKAYLNNLNAAFTYEINSFFLNNFLQNKAVETMRATINLTVGKNQFKAPVELQFNVQVETNWDDNVKPPFLDPTTVIQHEEKRLKNLNSKLKLHQNAFNQEEVTRLKDNPNSLFQLLGGFLPEQYFQYQINPLNITDNNNGLGVQTLTFKIKGRLWRDPNPIKKEVESNLFSFQINVYEDSLAAQPPTDLNKTWKIESKNGGDQEIEVDFQNRFDLAYILRRDGSGKIDVDATKFDAFLRKIATESSTTFFNITGTLPDDWSWDEYLEGFAPEVNNQKTGLTGTLLLQYHDSQNLSESLNVLFTFKNMTYDESLVEAQPTDKEQFDKFVADFQTTTKPKVQLDANAIHSGRQNVFQFSQLDEKNFLNFTNINWETLLKPIQNKIAIQAVNTKFNYLLNTVEFNWKLSGRGSWSSWEWIDQQKTTLTFNAPNELQDGFSQVSNDSDLALGTNALVLNGKLAQFNVNSHFVSQEEQQSQLSRFGVNWTWKARELATYLRFTFYQAFGDQASALNFGLIPKNGQNFDFTNLNHNFADYDVILKAKLNLPNGQANFTPYFQLFGVGFGLNDRTYRTGDVITLKLDISSIKENPAVFANANQILPGLGQGSTLGSGLGWAAVAADQLERTDLWSAQLATYNMSLMHNGLQLASQNAVHRFLSFNLLNRYHFQDPFWPEPNDSDWITSLNPTKSANTI